MNAVPPVYYGNPADADWLQARGNAMNNPHNNNVGRIGEQGGLVAQPGQPVFPEGEGYNNPAPRKCVWAMLLLSSLLVLRVQQDKYAEAVRWHGGVPDAGEPFVWESQPLVSGNDSYEATFLAPIMRRASTFVQPPAGASEMAITGLGPVLPAGLPPSALAGGEPMPDEAGIDPSADAKGIVSALLAGPVASLLPAACPGGDRAPCYVGVQSLPSRSDAGDAGAAPTVAPPGTTCHRFVGGSSLGGMAPYRQSAGRPGAGGVACVGSPRLAAAALTSGNDTVVLAWDPPLPSGTDEEKRKLATCLAAVRFPSMAPTGAATVVDFASTVLFDRATASILAVGFSGSQYIVITQLDSISLKPRSRYRLPVAVAWLLHTHRTSDGFLIFIGAEQPYVGTMFVVDMRKSEVYEQDPPHPSGNLRRPRRRRLPHPSHVESFSGDQAVERADTRACGPISFP